jgi:hypothetical protein
MTRTIISPSDLSQRTREILDRDALPLPGGVLPYTRAAKEVHSCQHLHASLHLPIAS